MDRRMTDATKPDVGAAKPAELKAADLSRLRPRERIALIRGQDASRWTDIYHQALMQPWSVFLLGLLAVFVGINAIFALFYVVDPHAIANARPGSFWDAFLFSIQSVGSTNYSTMAPRTAYAHGVVVVETFTINYAFLGLVMSLMFARFSRPFARIVFSHVALITPFDGTPTLMFRAANQRGNSVLDAEATVSVARRRVTREGIIMRRFEELKLVRCRTSLFALSWTIMHVIDETSPLYGQTAETLASNEIEILVMLSGVDDTLADRIYSRYTYTPNDIVWGQRFVDVLSFTPHGRRVVDLNRFHDTEEILQVDR
jgi:inward rectifier potassium channel